MTIGSNPDYYAPYAYLTARSKLLSLRKDALVIVYVVLPAVLCLILVGESGVIACEG